jgi:hypothetical protein
MSEENQPKSELLDQPMRRRALMLGAVGVAAVVSVRPALAQTAGSVLNCEIPVTGPHGAGMNIDHSGNLVAPDTPGSFPATGQKYSGEEVRREQSEAYTNYIRRLQAGQSGFTCFASLQMPH